MEVIFLPSPVGTFRCELEDELLVRVQIIAESPSSYSVEHTQSRLADQFSRYFAGKLKKFAVKYHLEGTPFQLAVWEYLASIVYGSVVTYGEVARAIGRPRALRAVGTAVGANPLPIVVPCHRVVGAGNMGGYHYGLRIKQTLLELEQQGGRNDRFTDA